MKKSLRSAFIAVVAGTIGLIACDAAPPPDSSPVTQPVASEAISDGETLTDVVREALAEIIRDEDPYSRARRLGALLPTLGPDTVAAAPQTLEDPSLDFGSTEIELLVRYWATYHPEDASRWAVRKSPPGFKSAAVLVAVQLWAKVDPRAVVSAAVVWATDRRLSEVSKMASIALVRGWFAANDPPELRQYIHDIRMSLDRQRALATYIRAKIQKHGLEAATRWAESLPDDDATYKTSAYRRVGSALPLFEHAAGIRWCEDHCDGPFGKNLRTIIARRWALSDGPAALAWLRTAPEGYETGFAARVAFEEWGMDDRQAALAWMADQTSGGGEPDSWLRPLFPVYAKFLTPDAPAEAVQWAERIESDSDREIILIKIAIAWQRADEAAAEAWLLQSPLSEEAREKVRGKQMRAPGAPAAR